MPLQTRELEPICSRELLGEGELKGAQLGLQGSDAPIELALGAQLREVGAQVRLGEAPEVALAAKARPLGEDGQGDDLRIAEQSRSTGFRWLPRVIELPPILHEHVQ